MIKSNRRRLPAVITPIISGDTSTQYISSPSRIHSTTITWVKVWKTEKRVHERKKKSSWKKSSWTSSWKESFLLPSHSLPLETHPPNTFISPPRNTAGSLHFPWTLSNLSIAHPLSHCPLCTFTVYWGYSPPLPTGTPFPAAFPFPPPGNTSPQYVSKPPSKRSRFPTLPLDTVHFAYTHPLSHGALSIQPLSIAYWILPMYCPV